MWCLASINKQKNVQLIRSTIVNISWREKKTFQFYLQEPIPNTTRLEENGVSFIVLATEQTVARQWITV